LDRTYLFTCPRCGETITVDAGVQELLLQGGCVVCDSTVSDGQFEPLD